MQNVLKTSIFALMVFVFGCNDKAPACSTLSWGETKVEEPGFDLKYSAGDQCENINDYWDIDIESIISKIQSMKFVKNSTCQIPDPESGEGVEFECPEFVPETIEFNEVVGCSFGTPPDNGDDCEAAPLLIKLDTETFFDPVSWEFSVYNPDFNSNNSAVSSKKDGKIMTGQFNNNELTSSTMKFTWTETVEGIETKKEMSLEYSVEVKE